MTPPAPRTASATDTHLDGPALATVEDPAVPVGSTDIDDEVDSDVTPPVPHQFRPAVGLPTPLVVDDGLTERERQVLAFERQWWKNAGAKEQAIRDLFEVSSTRYYQMVNTLLDKPEALAYDPVLVKRLRRLRATRTRTRAAGWRTA